MSKLKGKFEVVGFSIVLVLSATVWGYVFILLGWLS
jgi:hypothetical protein